MNIRIALRVARYKNQIGRRRLAHILGITKKELRNFECDKADIDNKILTRLFSEGIKTLK
jgi:transcriptional regulator with XRE-family HTH domain